MIARVALLGIVAANAVAARNIEEDIWLKCKPISATICDTSGCRPSESKVEIHLGKYRDDDGKVEAYYTRCGSDGCSSYDPIVGHSGEYVQFALPNNGLLAKLGPKDDLTDVATLMDVVFITRAQCEFGPPPIVRTNISGHPGD